LLLLQHPVNTGAGNRVAGVWLFAASSCHDRGYRGALLLLLLLLEFAAEH
jgi:hypothetical protein